MKKIILSLLLLFSLTIPALAVDQGAYSVYCGTNYYNPDTGEIDDGGTANAALGEGMCRSATATSALVEKDGDTYYVTIRLLLQSNTKDAIFWRHTGYNTYEQVNYEIMMEDAGADCVDYRFQVYDPFAPIRASMYVTPMGRSTVWYIELDESSLSADTGDFVVSVSATMDVEDGVLDVPSATPEVEETPAVGDGVLDLPSATTDVTPTPEVEETYDVGDGVLDVPSATPDVTPTPEVKETPDVGDGVLDVPSATTSNTGLYVGIAVAAIVAVGIAVVLVKKGKK